MSSAICFNLDQSKILLSGNELKQSSNSYCNTGWGRRFFSIKLQGGHDFSVENLVVTRTFSGTSVVAYKRDKIFQRNFNRKLHMGQYFPLKLQ